MINIHVENLIPISEVPLRIPSSRPGKRINVRTLYRWQREGRLETVRIGGRWYTSEEALERLSQPYTPIETAVVHGPDKALQERIRRMRADAERIFGPKSKRNP